MEGTVKTVNNGDFLELYDEFMLTLSKITTLSSMVTDEKTIDIMIIMEDIVFSAKTKIEKIYERTKG